MKTLIIHHLEPCWESAYIRIGKVDFCELQERFIEYLQNNQFDQVILTRFESGGIGSREGYLPELVAQIDKIETYGYGWEKDAFEQDTENFVLGGQHSEYVLIEDWMRELKNNNDEVTISGAFDGECIEDLEIALNHLKIPFAREEDLIVG